MPICRADNGASRRAHLHVHRKERWARLRFAHPRQFAYAIARSGNNSAICTAFSAAPLSN